MRSLAGIARESSGGAGLGDAPSNAFYVTTASDATLTNEQVLGTTIIIRDVGANIPAASIAGRLFIESDGSQIIYRDTGLAWVEIARGVVVSDVAYNATTWDGVTTVAPSKNAVRDKIEALWMTQTVYKTAETQVVNNSTVKVNDDTLFFPIAANEIWVGEFVLFVVGDATADFKFGVVVPSGVSALRYASHGDRSADTVMVGGPLAVASDTSIVAHGADATGVVIVCKFYVANGSTPGTVQLDWAQNTATVANTTVKIGSHVNYRRVA